LQQLPAPLLSLGATSAETCALDSSSAIGGYCTRCQSCKHMCSCFQFRYWRLLYQVAVLQIQVLQLPAPLLKVTIQGASPANTGAPAFSSAIEGYYTRCQSCKKKIQVLRLPAPLLEVTIPGVSPANTGAPASSSAIGGFYTRCQSCKYR
jgi:hypothetical protein